MTAGYIFSAIAFVICAFIDKYVIANCVPDPSDLGICKYEAIDNTIWIVPYIFITIGEVLISISGFNFMYEEVGKRTKSCASAIWLLGTSIGSLCAATLCGFLKPGVSVNSKNGNLVDSFQFYIICACIIFFAAIPQAVIANKYVPKAERISKK